ncbi:tRNA-guanine transglycosylase [Limosilactobacillus sp.]|uniref:tRNA-guanine transglycosylase n=1 Tax=Limosilactobacillus sp. TaxID=2773925 RepID=UPI00345EE2E4
MTNNFFTIQERSKHRAGRRGTLVTAHGTYQTPIIVPAVDDHSQASTSMIWANGLTTKAHYHEHQLKHDGGLHGIFHWSGGLISTAGGWEALNNSQSFQLDQKGIHVDVQGKQVFLSPEASAKEAAVAGVDIAVALSDCPPYYSSYDHIKKHVEQNNRWMKRAAQSHERQQLKMFGVIEGAGLKEMRQASVDFVTSLGFDGYEIGGLTKDVPSDELMRLVKETAPLLPDDQPRMLSRVSDPAVLQAAVNSGVDIILASPEANLAQLNKTLQKLNDNF